MTGYGCPGERATIVVEGVAWESLAFEHVDPLLVWRTVRSLGLDRLENTSYPAALKEIVGFHRIGNLYPWAPSHRSYRAEDMMIF